MDVHSPEYAAKVRRWSSSMLWALEADAFIQSCPGFLSGDWLDVGCGSGRMENVLRLNADGDGLGRYCGLEVNANYGGLGVDRKVYSGRGRFPYEVSSFDGAIAYHTLGHTHDPSETVHQMWKVVKQGGLVGICVPNHWHSRVQVPVEKVSGYEPDPTLKHQFTARSLRRLCESHLENVQIEAWGPRALGVGPKMRLFMWGRVCSTRPL